jgi:Tol biopolymer transport system component
LKVFDLESGTATHLVKAPTEYPEWTPDGKRLVFTRACRVGSGTPSDVANDDSPCGFYSSPLDQTAPPQIFLPDRNALVEIASSSLSPDGRTLVARVNLRANYDRDIWYRGPSDTTLKPLVTLPGNQFGPRISPDGKWVAFWTDSRPSRVFVTPLMPKGPIYQVSADAGEMPVWSDDGKRLYYLNGANGSRILAATLRFSPTFMVTRRDTLFDGGFDARQEYVAAYDVAPDGRFALMLRRDPVPQLVVVRDWQFELRERHKVP